MECSFRACSNRACRPCRGLRSTLFPSMQTNPLFETVFKSVRLCQIIIPVACVASVSVRLRSKKLGTRVKDHAKNGASKRAGRGGEERKKKSVFWVSQSDTRI